MNIKIKKVKPSYTLTKEEKSSLKYKDIQFRSPLEVVSYKILEQSGLSFKYEPIDYILQPKFKYPNEIWEENGGIFKQVKSKIIRPITHLPDFIIEDNFIIEVKGWRTPDFKLRRKMLLYKFLIDGELKHYFMPGTIRGVLKAVERIKELKK